MLKKSLSVLHAYKAYLPDVHGGIPHVIAMLVDLSRLGGESCVLVARYFGLARSFVLDGTVVRAVSSFGTLFSLPLAPSYPFVLARRAREVDVVVHHAPFPLTDIGLFLGLPKHVALVVHWHAEVVGRRVAMRLLTPFVRRALARADRIVVSDPAIVEQSSFLRPYAAKCTVVPFGCEVSYWAKLDESQRSSVARIKARHPRLVLAVGRIVSYKGFDVLLRAMCDLDATVVIIGEGPHRRELESQALQLGVAERVKFVGSLARDELKLYLHAANVLAFPSVTSAETFGIIQIEAMASGTPVVNTSLPTAVPHVARDGREGITVPPNDPEALADALRQLLDDPRRAEMLGAAGQARARAEYDHSRFLERMHAIYREVADRRRSNS